MLSNAALFSLSPPQPTAIISENGTGLCFVFFSSQRITYQCLPRSGFTDIVPAIGCSGDISLASDLPEHFQLPSIGFIASSSCGAAGGAWGAAGLAAAAGVAEAFAGGAFAGS